MVVASSRAGAVDRGDLCVKQPVDQCSSNQLAELGNIDGDTSGIDLVFESSLQNVGENGDLKLQYKDSTSTSFSNESTDSYSTRMGSSNDLYNNFAFIATTGEGNTSTLTVNGNEHDITVDSVDLSTNDYQVTIDGGVNTDSGNIGKQVNDLFGEGEDTQFTGAGRRNINHTLETGNWKYVTVDGTDYNLSLESITDNDDSIYYKVDGNGDNADEGDTINIGGDDFLVASVIPFGSGEGETRFTQYDAGGKYLGYGIQSDLTSPEGYNEYRLFWEGNSGATAYSDSVFFSVDRGNNLPYDKEVTVEDSVVKSPELVSGITPGSGISVNVFQEEDDPVNVSLVNAANDNTVATISGNRTDQGAFYTIYNDVKTSTLATFLDTSSEDLFTFPPAGDLMDSQGTRYAFYFEIKERDASQDTRTTKIYSVETDGSATNPAPVIHSVEAYNGSNWVSVQDIGYNELYKIRANVTDSNNEFLDVDLQYNNDYDSSSELEGLSSTGSEISFSKRDSGYYVWEGDRLENNTESGGYSLQVNASDGSTFTTESRSWSYPFGEPNVSISVTSSVVENNYFYPEITVSCSQYECVNQNETISVYLDPFTAEVAS